MKRHFAAWLVAGAVAVTGGLISDDATAIGPQVASQSFKVKQEAQAAYVKGKAAMAKGDYAAALESFRKADSLHPGAAPKYQIAVALDRLNQLEEAIAAYRTFIDSDPGPKYADRVVAAGQRIAELEKLLITKVTLQITPPNLGGLAITVDGNPVQGTEIDVKPGEHTIVVSAPGHVPVTETITARAGEPLAVPITLQPEQAAPPPTVTDTGGDEGGDPGLGLKIAGFSLIGAGVAAGVVSGVFGVMALGSASDFDATPTEELADDAENQAMLSDIFLGVGGALAIGGAICLYFGFTAEGGDEVVASPMPHLLPYAGPDGAGAAATWRF